MLDEKNSLSMENRCTKAKRAGIMMECKSERVKSSF